MRSSPRHSTEVAGNQPTTPRDTVIGDDGTRLDILPGGDLLLRSFDLGESHTIGRFRDVADAWAALDELEEAEALMGDDDERP